MYQLIGAYFLTTADQDVGFPAFQTSRANMLFTAILDKNLKITQFLPVILDKFHVSTTTQALPSYSLGDTLSHTFFRINDVLTVVDLSDGAAVEAAFAEFADKPFVILQLARYFAKQDKTRAVRAISNAAKQFDLDEESRFSFISSETSLVSFVDGVWEAARPEVTETLSIDDIFKQFETIDKIGAIELLRDLSFRNGPYWPYLFIVCESKFGIDEFLYILGKEFVRKLAIYERLPSIISAKVVGLVLDAYLKGEADRDLEETVMELMETSVFESLCTLEPSLFMKAFNATHSSADNLEIARDILDIFIFSEEAVIAPFKHELLARCRESLQKLEIGDLLDFAFGLLDADDERGARRIRRLADDRSRLLTSIQLRLRHIMNRPPVFAEIVDC